MSNGQLELAGYHEYSCCSFGFTRSNLQTLARYLVRGLDSTNALFKFHLNLEGPFVRTC